MYVYEANGNPVKITLKGVRRQFPNVSFPSNPSQSTLLGFGIFILKYDAKPDNDIVEEGPLERRGDEYFQTYTGRDLTPEEVRASTKVTLYQARVALAEAGVLGPILAAVEDLPEPNKTRAQSALEYATEVERTSPLIELVRTRLGWTHEQMDDLFTAAAAV